MLNEKKKHIIFVDRSDKPSRFMVDIGALEKERQENEILNKKKGKQLFFKKFNFTRTKKIKSRSKSQDFIRYSSGDPNEEEVKKKKFAIPEKIKRLAFIPIFIFSILGVIKLFKFLFKLCYKTGWLAVFFVRLIALAIIAVLKPFAKVKELFPIIMIKIGPYLIKPKKKLREDDHEVTKKEADTAEEFVDDEEEYEEDPDEYYQPNRFLTYISALRYKPALAFVLILLVLSLPLKGYSFYNDMTVMKGRVLGASETAINDMLNAGKSAVSMNIESAASNFEEASKNFLVAQTEIEEVSSLLSVLGTLVPNKTIKLASQADAVFEAGRLSAEMGTELTMAFEPLTREGDKSIAEIISNFYEHGQSASVLCSQLKAIIDLIDPAAIPDEFSDKFIEMKDRLSFLEINLKEFVEIAEQAQEFLGLNIDKRYLLVFQNNTELRASGGFIGSYALVDFRDGNIMNIEVPGGGSYDTEAGLLDRIVAPAPLHLVNSLWHFWDANWWPDWRMSAEKLMWFYEKSNGPTVDGVISLTPTVVERFLSVIGPVDMTEDYGVVINADNFWEVTQTFSEQKNDITNKPKKIIGDLFDKIIKELPSKLNKDTFIALAKQTEASLSEKHILMYFVDDDLEQKVAEYDWDGRVKDTSWDYLMVVNSNIAGGKSDKKIRETIEHRADVFADGSIINTVVIKREHTAGKNEPFSGVRNVDWMRIYVPLGSEFLGADGFERPAGNYFDDPDPEWDTDPDVVKAEEGGRTDGKTGTRIFEEHGKTVFANWSMVDTGQTEIITIKYKLPFKLVLPEEEGFFDRVEDIMNPVKKDVIPYTLLTQKQPGSIGSYFKSTLNLPENYKMAWVYPADIETSDSSWQVDSQLVTDKYWAALLEIK